MDPSTDTLLAEVYRDQRARLWGFFLRGAEDRGAAEDLLQEVFLRLWDHRERLAEDVGPHDREGMRRYVWRVARNLMIDEIRQLQRKRGGETPMADEDHELPEAATAPAGQAETLEHADCLRVVRETVGRLSNVKARRCLELWLEGRDLPSIAREAGLAPGQVRGLLQRGRAEVIQRAGNRLRSPLAAAGGRARES